MPPVSEAQRRAMQAAKAGKSTLDIPQSVGAEFSAADTGGELPEKAAPKKRGKRRGLQFLVNKSRKKRGR